MLDKIIDSYLFGWFYQNYLSIVRGIKNLIKWFPIVWRDRDWDHDFIERVLYYKMVNTYNFFISNDAVTNWETKDQAESLKALRICIIILERRSNHFYIDICSNMDLHHAIKRSFEIEQRDEKILGYLIGKYLSYWWD